MNDQSNVKIKMPKTRAEFEAKLMDAFMADCTWAYGVEHRSDVYEQEKLGAKRYVGQISDEECEEKMLEIREEASF